MGSKNHLYLTYTLIMNLNFCLTASEYRLPKSIVPVNYDVILKLDADAFTTNNFQGEVNITLNVLKRTDQILIHSKNLDIISVNLRKPNENFNLTHRSYMSDALTDILTITSENQLSPGFYYLDITYNATFNPYDMHGFYKSTYPNEEGKTEFLATTQFEVTNARRAFPCFDEPSFKATFNLSVVYPKGYNVIANTLQNGNVSVTSENLEIVNFKTTPRMSTYLNAFVISNFTCDTVETKLPFRVCSRAEAANERKYALDISPKLMNYLENFTGIPYNVSGIGKMDQVAIPDFSAGAMENWGLITYRESTLLWDPNESSNLYKQRVASVIAHEFAHMWFGNLVTLKWWSDVYLSEGFARYFQYFATDRIETEWEMDKQFVVEQVHSALFTDSFSASEALSSPVTTPKEISSKFDLISYNKGASVIRMIAHVMGLEQFQRGIQQYLQINKFNNTCSKDLWNSLKNFTSLNNFEDFVKNWTFQPGYPVLHVKANGQNIIITQERFLLYGTNKTKWHIPITYTTSNIEQKFTNTTTQIWFSPNNTELILKNKIISKSDWIIFNNQQVGYYRVKYDENLLRRIHSVLKTAPTNIHVLNRAQIVDDLFNFAIAEKISFSEVFDIISFLSEDVDYYPWYSAFNGFATTLQKISDQNIQKKLSTHILNLMNKLYNSVPITKTDLKNQIDILKQAKAVAWACRLNNTECVNNSKRIFSAYKNGTSVNKNLKVAIYCTALRHSDNVEEDWNFMWNKFQETKIATEQVTILWSLGCTTNEELLIKYLHHAINESSQIRRQDSTLVFSSVISGHSDGFKIALRFLTANYQLMLSYYRDEKVISNLLKTIIVRFTDQAQLEELNKFIRYVKMSNELKIATEKTARYYVLSNKRIENQLKEYFKQEYNLATATTATGAGYLTLVIAALLLLK